MRLYGNVQGRGGFVKYDKSRLQNHGPGDGDALALPTGQRARPAVKKRREVQCFDDVLPGYVGWRIPRAFLGITEIARGIEEGKQTRVLKDVPDAASVRGYECVWPLPGLAGEIYRAACPVLAAGDDPQQGGLAAPARPK